MYQRTYFVTFFNEEYQEQVGAHVDSEAEADRIAREDAEQYQSEADLPSFTRTLLRSPHGYFVETHNEAGESLGFVEWRVSSY